jgi:Rod binding domain-containing protein
MSGTDLMGQAGLFLNTPRTPAVPGREAGTNDAKVQEVAQEFEAVFLAQMLNQMFEGIAADPMFGGGPGEQMYRSMMLNEYGKIMSDAGGVGIAEALRREIITLQEVR